MAIAFFISSAAEIENGVSTALELAAALDKPLAILCLQPSTEGSATKKSTKVSKPGKGNGKDAASGDKASGDKESDFGFTNRVSYFERAQAAVAKHTQQKGFGGPGTEVFEIPVALAEIRTWLVRPPFSDKLGQFQIEMMFISFDRGAGSEKALKLKNRLFNRMPCEVIFISVRDDFDWSAPRELVACVGNNAQEMRTARQLARKLKFTRTNQASVDTIEGDVHTVIVGVRGRNTHIERNSAWNSVRRNDQFQLAMAVNPADSWLERCHWNIDNGLLTVFADYQMTREQREQLAEELKHGTRPSPEFILFMSVATLLAAIGLLENSGAVVIGAMLVAPLMTPLLGAGLAMLQGNWPRFVDAVQATTWGISIAFVIGMVVGFIAAVLPKEMFSGAELKLTGEMISRSHPNLLDPLIGLAAGLAGGFAIGRDKKIGALAGVAIAAALVPPIATAGLETAIVLLCALQQRSWEVVGRLLAINPTELLSNSGFLANNPTDMQHVHLVFAPLALFVMNACAVILGTYVGLRLVGMHRTMYPRASRQWVSLAMVAMLIALVIILIAIPLIAHYQR